jgi:hypothetical protein
MAMFTAYFDASGNAIDQPFIIVSGYIANLFQWREFEKQWAAVHKQYSVNLPFHMAEFMAALNNPQDGYPLHSGTPNRLWFGDQSALADSMIDR